MSAFYESYFAYQEENIENPEPPEELVNALALHGYKIHPEHHAVGTTYYEFRRNVIEAQKQEFRQRVALEETASRTERILELVKGALDAEGQRREAAGSPARPSIQEVLSAHIGPCKISIEASTRGDEE